MRHAVPSLALALVLVPTAARAESDAGACNVAVAFPASGLVPANIPGFVVRSSGNDLGDGLALLQVGADGTETVVDTTESVSSAPSGTAIVPNAPLSVGAHYRIRVGPCLYDPGVAGGTFDYTAVEPVVGPVSFTVALSPLHRRRWADSDVTRFSIDATIEHAESLDAWLSLYEIAWSAETPSGTIDPVGFDVFDGRREIPVECPGWTPPLGPSVSIPPGAATVRAVATSSIAPTLTVEATTTTSCDEAITVPTEAGTSTPGAGTGSADAGPGSGFAGSPGCAVSRARTSGLAASALLLACAAVLLRRRRRVEP